MNIYLDDPDPGRCKNVRHDLASGVMLRCLDYEADRHVCTFPDPPPPLLSIGSGFYSTVRKPVPWVKPDDRAPLEARMVWPITPSPEVRAVVEETKEQIRNQK